jgi:hypothetical protein
MLKKFQLGLKTIVLLFCLIFLAAMAYAYILWYFPTILTLLFCISFFSYLNGKFILFTFKNILPTFHNIKYVKSLSLLFLLLVTVISWWLYWIFEVDLSLNQSSWVKIDIPFVPIDYIRYTKTDFSDVIYLLTHPDKVYSYLVVRYKNNSFFGEDQNFFWALEILISSEITRWVVWRKYPLTQFGSLIIRS